MSAHWDADTLVRCISGLPATMAETIPASVVLGNDSTRLWATPGFKRLPQRGKQGDFTRTDELVHGSGICIVGDTYDGDDVDEAFVAAVNAGTLTLEREAVAALVRQQQQPGSRAPGGTADLSSSKGRASRLGPACQPPLSLEALEHALETLERAAFIRSTRLEAAEAAEAVSASRIKARSYAMDVLRAGITLLNDDSERFAGPCHGARRPRASIGSGEATMLPNVMRAPSIPAAAAGIVPSDGSPQWQLPLVDARALLVEAATKPPPMSPPRGPTPQVFRDSVVTLMNAQSSSGLVRRRASLTPSTVAAVPPISPKMVTSPRAPASPAPPLVRPPPLIPRAAVDAIYYYWVARRTIEHAGAPLLRCFQTLGPGDAPDVDSGTLVSIIGFGAIHARDAEVRRRQQRSQRIWPRGVSTVTAGSHPSASPRPGRSSIGDSNNESDSENEPEPVDDDVSMSSVSDVGDSAATMSSLRTPRVPRASLSAQGQLRDIDANIRALARIRRLRLQLERGRILLDLVARREKLKRDRARLVAGAVRKMCRTDRGTGKDDERPVASAADPEQSPQPPCVAPSVALFTPPPPPTVGAGVQPLLLNNGIARAVGGGSHMKRPLYCVLADTLASLGLRKEWEGALSSHNAASVTPMPTFVKHLVEAAVLTANDGNAGARPLRVAPTSHAIASTFGKIRVRVPRAVWTSLRCGSLRAVK